MPLEEQLAFEVRLAEDDELARSVRAAMLIDEHLSLAAAQDLDRERRSRRPRRPAVRVVAVAALLLTTLGVIALAWLGWPTGADRLAVAVLPTPLHYDELVAELGLEPAQSPAEAMRGDEAVRPDGASRVDALLLRLRELQQRAIAAASGEVRGEAFVVPVQTEREVWVAVIGKFDDGGTKLLFPDAIEPEVARTSGWLLPGLHVLPAPPAAASPTQRETGIVTFSPGFVVPRQRQRVDVLVITMPTPPSPVTWQRLRDRIAQPGGDFRADLAGILPDATIRGFLVRSR